MKQKWTILWSVVLAAMLLVSLSSATLAWFTSNRNTETDRVTARTGTSTLELQISRTGGAAFAPQYASGGEIGEITLKESENPLLPVSTVDLQSFLYCPFTEDGVGTLFLPVPDESYYYHDTFYLQAKAENMPEGAKFKLFLDNTDTPIVRDATGELLTAARLGLTFDGGSPVILSLSDVTTGSGNTSLDGTLLEPGQVLTLSGGEVTARPDPAISLARVQFGTGAAPLATLELNRIYTLDIYFYLEGCDPDCLTERVATDEALMNLAFFGQLAE